MATRSLYSAQRLRRRSQSCWLVIGFPRSDPRRSQPPAPPETTCSSSPPSLVLLSSSSLHALKQVKGTQDARSTRTPRVLASTSRCQPYQSHTDSPSTPSTTCCGLYGFGYSLGGSSSTVTITGRIFAGALSRVSSWASASIRLASMAVVLSRVSSCRIVWSLR